MYETIISVNNAHIGWLEELNLRISEDLGGKAVTACSVKKDFAFLCVGADGKRSVLVRKCLENAISALILGTLKYEYVDKNLGGVRLPVASRKLLCHALAGFDRETEEEIVREILTVGKTFSLDGFYRFRMGELISRWSEICKLAKEHGAYLSDEDTMNELLRFLIDASRTKSRAEVFRLGGKYRLVEYLRDGSSGEAVFDAFDDLLCRLIDLAPSETILNGFDYDATFKTLNTIFDAKCNILR